MGDLTPNFSKREFRCKDGSEHDIDCRLLAMLEGLRAALGEPITITSGYRSASYNRKIGGAPGSYHVKGMAADIQIRNKTSREVYDVADNLYPVCGLGLYEGWVHLDSRQFPARWEG